MDNARPNLGIVARAALGALWVYKRTLSPLFYFLGARCRHGPACSDYAAEAFRRHGAWRGFWLSFSRLARCHPFGSHGWDPVPETLADTGWRFWRYGDWSWRERRGDRCADGAAPTDESSVAEK